MSTINHRYYNILGDQSSRTLYYKNFLTKLLKEKRVKTVHDMACGTGIDSVMLLEEGFKVSYEEKSNKVKLSHKFGVWKIKDHLHLDMYLGLIGCLGLLD